MSRGSEPTPVENRRVRVLAVDDHPPFRALLHDLVGATRELEIVGEADSGERAVELAWKLQPDMILMDVRMPGLGGIEAARRIKMSKPATVIVLFSSTHPDELQPSLDRDLADALLWKRELQPKRLDEIWRQSQE